MDKAESYANELVNKISKVRYLNWHDEVRAMIAEALKQHAEEAVKEAKEHILAIEDDCNALIDKQHEEEISSLKAQIEEERNI